MTTVLLSVHPGATTPTPALTGPEQLEGRTVASIVRRRFDPYTTVVWDDALSQDGSPTSGTVRRYGLIRDENVDSAGVSETTMVRNPVLARVELIEGRRS